VLIFDREGRQTAAITGLDLAKLDAAVQAASEAQ
jgi:hypothetical protein